MTGSSQLLSSQRHYILQSVLYALIYDSHLFLLKSKDGRFISVLSATCFRQTLLLSASVQTGPNRKHSGVDLGALFNALYHTNEFLIVAIFLAK